jgi:hypothetical protein
VSVEVVRPGEGPLFCTFVLEDGRTCGHHEVDGLGFCLWHVPDEMLEEAEEVTGHYRCRHDFGEPGACHNMAVTETDPPACKIHGANRGSNTHKAAMGRVVEGRVQDRMVEILSENGERLLNPKRLDNPLIELLRLADEMAEWKDIMRGIVVYLVDRQRLRSAHSKVGEQLRAEVLLYERALERLAKILQDIARLGIETKLASIEERQVQVVETALAAALNASGLDIVDQQRAKTVLRRELVKASRKAS